MRFSSVYGITGKKAKKVYEKQLDLVNLSDKTDCYVDVLSRGQKQRLCLARCLLCDPKLLILDEPASGLDPRARFEMKEVLCNLSQSGKTILISSHILPELAQMCTNIGIVESGKMVLSGTVDEIMQTERSVTGDYLSGRITIPVPSERLKPTGWLTVRGAAENNLKNPFEFQN